ncbi:zinc finger protein rts2 [Moniliophthora roreri]|nr:zinc finger protein rts2 [Moniliophthora roreri]
MNATRWVTLTEFVEHLGRTGVARVDETVTEMGCPKAPAKADVLPHRMDRQRERMHIAEQIERATAEAEKQAGPSHISNSPPFQVGEGTEPVELSIKPSVNPADITSMPTAASAPNI